MRFPSRRGRVSPVAVSMLCCLVMVLAAWPALAERKADVNEKSDGLLVNFGQASNTVVDTYQAHFARGQELMQKGDLEGAACEFTECTRLFEPFVAARERYGDYRDQKTNEVYYQPKATALVNLGHAYRSMGRLDSAIKAYSDAVDIAPGYTHAHESLGRALTDQGQKYHLDRARLLNRGDMAADETEANMYRQAIAHLHVARTLEPDSASVRIALSNALRLWRYFDGAVAHARKATEIDPTNWEAHYALGRALMDWGQIQPAVESYTEAARLAAEVPPVKQAEIQNELGIALAGIGKFDEALAAHRKSTTLAPSNAQYQNNLGAMLRTTGKAGESVSVHQEAVTLNPFTTEYYMNLAASSRESGDLHSAVVAYRKALRLNPRDGECHHQLGLTLYRRSDPANAIARYGSAAAGEISDQMVASSLADIAMHFLGDRRLRLVDAMDPRCYEVVPRLLLRPYPWPTIKQHLVQQWKVLDNSPLYGDTRLRLQDTIIDFESLFPTTFNMSGQWNKVLQVTADGAAAAVPADLRPDIIRQAPADSPLGASLVTLAPEVRRTAVGAAAVLRQDDDLQDALAEVRWAASLPATTPATMAGILNNLGKIYSDMGEPGLALSTYNRALKYKEDIGEIHFNAGVALAELNKMDEAMVAWRRARQLNVQDSRLFTYLGIALLQRTELDMAYAEFRRAAEAHKDYGPAHYYVALVEALRQSASPITQMALENGRVTQPLLRPHYDARAEFIRTEALTRALEAFKQADTADPDRREIYYYVGVELALQDPAAAGVKGLDVIHSVAQGRGFVRDWAAVTNNLAACAAISGDLPKATSLLRIATWDEPHYALAHWNLGRVLMQQGQEAEGRQALATAERLSRQQGLAFWFKREPTAQAAPAPRMPWLACREYRFKTLLQAFDIPEPYL